MSAARKDLPHNVSVFEQLVNESSSEEEDDLSGSSGSDVEETTTNNNNHASPSASAITTDSSLTAAQPQKPKCGFVAYFLKRRELCKEKHEKKKAEKLARKQEKEAQKKIEKEAKAAAKQQQGTVMKPPPKKCSWVPTTPELMQHAEDAMLKPIAQWIGSREFVAGLNTISSLTKEERHDPEKMSKKLHVVLLHGFGGGSALWAQQWEVLATCRPTHGCSELLAVHAVDLPGFARNPREKPVAPTTAANNSTPSKLDPKEFFACDKEARTFMFTALDRWFEAMQLCQQRVILVGHSFGGYVSAHYTQHARKTLPIARAPAIEHLILCDPWGMSSQFRKFPAVVKRLLKVVRKTSPLGPLRAAGPLGLKLFRRIRPDFADRWSGFLPDPSIFYEYTYHCNAQSPPIGERAFISCMDPDGNTLGPVDEFLLTLFQENANQRHRYHSSQRRFSSGSQGGVGEGKKEAAEFSPSEASTEPQQEQQAPSSGGNPHAADENDDLLRPPLHVTFIYGQNTWMNKSAGYDVAVALQEFVLSRSDLTDSEGNVEGVVQYMEVPNAAHQVNSDNAEGFNQAILSAIDTAVNGVSLM